MLPCQRKTHSQTRKGRNLHAISSRATVTCNNCNEPKLPHAACKHCGYVRAGLQLQGKNTETED